MNQERLRGQDAGAQRAEYGMWVAAVLLAGSAVESDPLLAISAIGFAAGALLLGAARKKSESSN